MSSKIGDTLRKDQLNADIESINRLNLFFSLDTTIQFINGQYTIQVAVVEANYLYPIAGISGFDKVLKTVEGFNQINFLGKAQRLGFQHQWYQRHSFFAFYQVPFATQKRGHQAALSKYSTIEPLYGMDTVSIFDFDNYSAQVGMHFWWQRIGKIGLNIAGFAEKYHQRDAVDLGFDTTDFSFLKYQIVLPIEWNTFLYADEKVDGIRAQLSAETVQTIGFSNASFFKADVRFRYLKSNVRNGNFGVQIYSGWASNRQSPFSPFVVDGFLNVRGIGNRIARGTAITAGNMEYRQRLFKTPLLFFQGIVFMDNAILREPGEKLVFTSRQIFHSYGAGVRVQLNKYFKTVFRVDYSISQYRKGTGAISFGFDQFF